MGTRNAVRKVAPQPIVHVQHPAEAIADDERLLVEPPGERWFVVDRPAVVLGLALHRRAADVIEPKPGVEVLTRQAGGGVVLLDEGMLCYAVALPLQHPLVHADLTESYCWLGEHFAERLRQLGVDARRVEVEEARADVGSLHGSPLLTTCYGALSPHEVVVGSAKLVGLAQIRWRHAALFQVGILLRDQSRLGDLLRLSDDAARFAVREALARRTVGLASLISPLPELRELASALSPESLLA